MTTREAGLWPDVPGLVHGIVSVSPPVVQCDGCGARFTGGTLALTVILSGITFHPDALGRGEGRRMCRACWDSTATAAQPAAVG
ncbi:hypothetical protein AX769_22205 (plasmid) [Frondihabitans sp. PAMC 28766]|nr:hypothetical protein AX769_22205 [Frondihabitans sp. PAMC 28766]